MLFFSTPLVKKRKAAPSLSEGSDLQIQDSVNRKKSRVPTPYISEMMRIMI